MKVFKLATLVIGLLPFFYCVYYVSASWFGYEVKPSADPARELVRFNGECALIFLLLTQVPSPLRELTGINLIAIRRILGLLCFTYASLHFTAYLVLLLEFRFSELAADLVKRPYISVGFAAFILLIPLAITSNSWMVLKLYRRWKTLHMLVYPALLLALLHLIWLTKNDYSSALVYLLLGLTLLLSRAWRSFTRQN